MNNSGYGIALCLTAMCVTATYAAPLTTSMTDFNAFTNGSVNGQGGWGVTGTYDQKVVDLGGGNKALQVSNKVTTGAFGDQTFAPRPGGTGMTPADPVNSQPFVFAGESSTGAGYNRFIGSFDFRSVLDVSDPGSFLSVSPDNGQGGRQGYIGLQNTVTGVDVIGYDITNAGGFNGPNVLASLAYATWHTIRYEIDFYEGANNDVARIYLDSTLVSTSNSWEQYYAINEPVGHPNGVPVQTLGFFARGGAAANAQGFYFDNVSVQLDNLATVPEPGSLALAGLALLGVVAARRRRV